MMRRGRLILLLLLGVAAVVCVACSSGEERVNIEAGGFRVVRQQHTASNWNTGGTSTSFTFAVRYHKSAFQFPTRSGWGGEPDQTTTCDATDIAAAFLVSRAPAALLVLAGDPNNHATWNLLIDTPSGLRSEHVAYHSVGRDLAWLDGDSPVPIDAAYSLLNIEGGRWLWVDNQALIDLATLRVHHLDAVGHGRDGAAFVAFSPDRRKMARLDTVTDADDYRSWQAIILENDIASGAVRSFAIDRQTMWFDDSRDIDQHWLQSYFQWRQDAQLGYALQRLAHPHPRPYHGRIQLDASTQALQYHVPRLGFAHRQAVMEFLATALHGKSTLEEDEPQAALPPPATAPHSETAATADAALAPSIEPISAAQLEVDGNQLTIYFSARGLSIENRDVALNELVRRVATTLDATFTSARGKAWLIDGPAAP